MDKRQKPCLDCGVTTRGNRCRSCAAIERWKTRPPLRTFVTYNGVRYYPHEGSYWRSSRHKGAVLLHRAVWEAERGPIPVGWHVHHLDHNPSNNECSNLQAMSESNHLSGEHSHRAPWTEEQRQHAQKHRLAWWAARQPWEHTCEQCGQNHLTTATRVRFCSPTCNSAYWNNQRRTEQNRPRV